MQAKVSVTLVALAMLSTALVASGFATAALPTEATYPTVPDTNCTGAVGNGGTATGTTTGYHVYANDRNIGLLDDCTDTSPIVPFVSCAVSYLTTNIIGATLAALLTLNVFQALGILTGNTLALVEGSACVGIGGTGVDGEFEYGSDAAALNVRTGSTGGEGSGVNVCQDSVATAHHGTDKQIFVLDAVHGGDVAFTVTSDWARRASTSTDGLDDNVPANAGGRACGDGAIEPCAGTTLSGDTKGAATEIAQGGTPSSNPPFVPPTSVAELNADLDWYNGCNTLDYSSTVAGNGLATPNSFNLGAALSTIHGAGGSATTFNGGANGYITVFIDTNTGIHVSDPAHPTPSSTPVAGWVWTGP